MGLANDIGYEIGKPDGLHGRFVRAVRRRPLASLTARVATPLDRITMRITRGRTTATAVLTGLPVLWLETAGALTGRTHEVPLLGIPTGAGGLAVIGSAFGTARTPAWVHNLRTKPDAVVTWDGARHPVTAVEIHESDEIWAVAIDIYPGYADYRRRASHRTIAVFELVHH